MSDTEMVGERWQSEVTAPDGRRLVVVAVRRHDALHEDQTPYEARGQGAALVVGQVAEQVRRGEIAL